MALSLPHPFTLVDLAISTVGRAVGAASAVASAPARLLRLVNDVEVLVVRVTTVVDAAERAVGDIQAVTTSADVLVRQAAQTSAAAETVVGQAAQTAVAAETVVGQAARTAAVADELVTAYEPAARRFIEHLSPEEVDAAIRMVDELPKLAEHLNTDVMPILATLDRVGPDIHELLGVTRDLRQAIVGIPGFGMLRRRGEEKDAG